VDASARSRSGGSLAPAPPEHAAKRVRRDRLRPEDREIMILELATHFFATHGFSARIRDLARHIGISPSLVFRYFGNKQRLVERVFDHAVSKRWNDAWKETLSDRTQPMRQRLKAFYHWFLQVSDDFDYIRCGIYSGLDGYEVANRHFESNISRILQAIALELRSEKGIDSREPVSAIELEHVWLLHAVFVNYLARKYVHHRTNLPDRDAMIDAMVDLYFDGAGDGERMAVRTKDRSWNHAGERTANLARTAE
jgi:AcrR family transcriptional regulator